MGVSGGCGRFITLGVLGCLLLACEAGPSTGVKPGVAATPTEEAQYIIGPGDQLQIFVWRNEDLSVTVPVRPDGKISTPLAEDMVAVGKTPTELARAMEKILANYIKSPTVNVIVTSFVGRFNEQIRVVGAATNPRALPYRENISLLDVMIEVGGLTEFAAGNRAKVVRRQAKGADATLDVRIEDLISDGDIGANIFMRPGDIVIIPTSTF